MAGFFDRLKKKVFSGSPSNAPAKGRHSGYGQVHQQRRRPESTRRTSRRDPYFIQIGMDFGTSFTKVVCRDVIINKPWVHLPKDIYNRELPFLISSSLCFDEKTLSHPSDANRLGQKGTLDHVKMALQAVALNDLESDYTQRFKKLKPIGVDLREFVESCAVYLLAGIIGEVRLDIAKRFPGKVDGDQVLVNLAVPVASIDDQNVEQLFDRVLHLSWCLSESVAGHPAMSLGKVIQLILENEHRIKSVRNDESCFIYPEVSANVQGFIRSRSSQPGLYLFSDTGAGTVDQSLFRFSRSAGKEFLTFLSAQVIELGSSRIEELAMKHSNSTDWETLEKFRKMKESGEVHPSIQNARSLILSELGTKTKQTIAVAKRKLTLKNSINDLKIIFGGGGHCDLPYAKSVMRQFDTDIFRIDLIRARRRTEREFDRGMPDLKAEFNFNQSQARWSRRLSVAYGLSFVRDDLAPYRLPNLVEDAKEDEIVRSRAATSYAPTNDDC